MSGPLITFGSPEAAEVLSLDRALEDYDPAANVMERIEQLTEMIGDTDLEIVSLQDDIADYESQIEELESELIAPYPGQNRISYK